MESIRDRPSFFIGTGIFTHIYVSVVDFAAEVWGKYTIVPWILWVIYNYFPKFLFSLAHQPRPRIPGGSTSTSPMVGWIGNSWGLATDVAWWFTWWLRSWYWFTDAWAMEMVKVETCCCLFFLYVIEYILNEFYIKWKGMLFVEDVVEVGCCF